MEYRTAERQIPLSVPNLDLEIVDNLKECIETGWVSTGGRFISEFEQQIAKYVGTKDAVSAQSGTAGIHVALRILGVESGDEVIVPTLTFVAAVNPVKYLGAEPIFMDCDESLCMNIDKVKEFCEEECSFDGHNLRNNTTGKVVKAVVAVHIFGNMVDMEKLMLLAEKYNIKVLEDATEALGSYYTAGKYKGMFAGTIGDIGVYSFNANKIITTGGGGMIVSQNQKYLDKARYLTITAKETNPEEALFFVHGEVGYNYRMLNIQAALGVSQIEKLESFINTKVLNYNKYKEELNSVVGAKVLPFISDIRSNHWFYSIYIDNEKFGIDRNSIMNELISKGIQCRPIWKLIHTLKPYIGTHGYRIEKAIDYANNIINMPCSTSLGEEDVVYICNAIKEIQLKNIK